MPAPKDRPQPGPGAPLTAEREQYRRLMAQGLNNHQACLQIGVHPTTGSRWSKGRNMVDHNGTARYYPPVHAEPKPSSPRYLSRKNGSSSVTYSRPDTRNARSPRGWIGARRRSRERFAAISAAPGTTGRSARTAKPSPAGRDRANWPTTTSYGTSSRASSSSGGARSRSATLYRSSSPARPKGTWCRKPSTRPSTCRDAANCAGSWLGRCEPAGPGASRTAAATPAGRAPSSTRR